MDNNKNKDIHDTVTRVPLSVTATAREHDLPATGNDRIALPLPPAMGEQARFEMEVYARFMRHLRGVPNSRMEIKILSSLQFTADMMDTSDALVAKTLCDLGLRAPRKAFPVTFLDFVDKTTTRRSWEFGAPPASVVALREHWDRIGEDRFTLTGQYAVQGGYQAAYHA
jgi:hypothetical protein